MKATCPGLQLAHSVWMAEQKEVDRRRDRTNADLRLVGGFEVEPVESGSD